METNYRRCISCRRVAHKNDLWRIVRVFPSHQLQLDLGMGRSAYLCSNESCLSAAQKKNRLGRALKASVPIEIYQILWQRLSAMQADASKQLAAKLPNQNQIASEPKPQTRPPTVL
ncbi:YlxR family protein [Microcoleus sp. FACHB-68]|uniref:YlxR family protein n=1 Tax=Microcoleus sp. FACHB-68 TaxID=2692826 RepID=UPI001689F493|nr:YlxR family protein [Microcoleus sp. FACHB-68]MBD1938366.1 YlxR family protein [Microcoleus sp. FACHB-68]